MEYRRFGQSDLRTPAVGLGFWTFGGEPYGPVPKETAVTAMKAALDHGVTLFDGAPYYGESEAWFGEAFPQQRHEIVLVTKCNYRRGPQDRQNVVSSLEQSLRDLRTDYVDLYLLVYPEPAPRFEESVRALAEVQKAGKARYVGVLGFEADDLQRAAPWAPLVANQVGYSLVDRRVEREIFPTCANLGIGVMAFAPLAGGLLGGNVQPDVGFPVGDPRAKGGEGHWGVYRPEHLQHNLQVVDRLRAYAVDRGATVAQLALAWVLANPAVSVALIGTRQPERIAEDAACLDVQLDAASTADIEAIARDLKGVPLQKGRIHWGHSQRVVSRTSR